MKDVLLILLVIIAIAEIIALVIIKTEGSVKALDRTVQVVDPKQLSTESPSPSPSPTPSPTPTPTSTPSPTPTKAPTPEPQPKVTSQQIYELINRFAGQYGVDPHTIRHIALCESGFNQYAKNLSYGGLFQFSPGTWQSIRGQMGEDKNPDLRFNAEEAIQTTAYAISVGKRGIWPNCNP